MNNGEYIKPQNPFWNPKFLDEPKDYNAMLQRYETLHAKAIERQDEKIIAQMMAEDSSLSKDQAKDNLAKQKQDKQNETDKKINNLIALELIADTK